MSTEIKPVVPVQKLQLQNMLPESFALTWSQFAFSLFASSLFVIFCYLPVADSATWQAISEAEFHNVEQQTAVLPFAAGMRFIPIGQSGKQVAAFLFGAGGAQYVGLGFTILQFLAFGLWAYLLYRIKSSRWSLLAVAAIMLMCLVQLDGFHTGVFGQICGALLILSRLTKSADGIAARWSESSWLRSAAVFLIMAAWANLDASFVLGLGGLCLLVVSKFWETLQQTGQLSKTIACREFQKRVWILELGFLATLFTPQGIRLWESLFWWQNNPIVSSLRLGEPASLFSWTTLAIAIGWGIWVVNALRAKRCRLSTSMMLLATSSTILVCLSPQFVFWFVAAMAVVTLDLLPVKSTADDKLLTETENENSNGSSETSDSTGSIKFAFTLLTGLAIWLAFCFSPFGTKLLGGKERTEKQIVGRQLPIEGKQFLENNRVKLLHCPVYWSDWLSAGTAQPMMVNSGPHNTPNIVNFDYQEIFDGRSDWRALADKYALTGLLVDKANQQRLIRNLRRRPGQWQLVHEDSQCILYRRSL